MKVCPKCGYVDRSEWRQNRWRTNVEFTKLDTFRLENPTICKDLERGKPFVRNTLYAYRLSGKGKHIVERVYIKDFEAGGKSTFHIPREKVDHLKDPWQTKIITQERKARV